MRLMRLKMEAAGGDEEDDQDHQDHVPELCGHCCVTEQEVGDGAGLRPKSLDGSVQGEKKVKISFELFEYLYTI